MRLREELQQALLVSDAVHREDASKLAVANFTHALLVDALKRPDADPEELLGSLRPASGDAPPGSLEASLLAAERTRWAEAVERAKLEVNVKTDALVSFLGDPAVQQHLCDDHVEPLSIPDLEEAYGPQVMSAAEPILERDHVLATLTEDLGHSEKGRAFLGELLDDDRVKTHVAFGQAWGFVKIAEKVISNRDPLRKLAANLLPVAQLELQRALAKGTAAALESSALHALGKRLGDPGFPSAVAAQVDALRGKGAHLDNLLIEQRSKNLFDVINPTSAQKLEGAWVGVILDTVSLVIAVGEGKPLSAMQDRDWAGLASNGASLGHSVLELVEQRAVHKGPAPAMAFKVSVKVAGLTAGLLSASLSAWDAYEADARGDDDAATLHSTSAALGAVAAAASFAAGMVAAGAITAPLLVAAAPGLAVVGLVGSLGSAAAGLGASFAKDAPVITWLKRSPWGTVADLPHDRVIPAYAETAGGARAAQGGAAAP
jgi:hypothetical protein